MSEKGDKSSNVPVLKTAEQYGLWKYRMQMSLRKREIYDVIENQLAMADANATTKKRIYKAMALMVECLDDKHVLMVKDCARAYDMWHALENRYEQNTATSKLFLRKKLQKHKPNPGESVDDCFARFSAVVSDLSNRGVVVPDDEQISILLYCWPEKYNVCIAALENIEADLTVELIQARLGQEELKWATKDEELGKETPTAAALSASTRNPETEDKEEKIKCEYTWSCAFNANTRGSSKPPRAPQNHIQNQIQNHNKNNYRGPWIGTTLCYQKQKKTKKIGHLRVFGSIAYAHIPKDERRKLDSKAEKCRLIGYSLESKAYRLWSIKRRIILESRDVIFDECNFNETKGENNYSTQGIKEDSVRRSQRLQEQRIHEDNVKNHVSMCMLAGGEFEEHPKTYAEAMRRQDKDKWHEATLSEYNSLLENRTWTLTDLPDGRKTISCRWVYTIKRKPDGTVDRYKARLVARRFSQNYGDDYTETFSPVAHMTSIRIFLALCAEKKMHIHQMDVTTAFLNGDIDGFEIFMDQPEGFAEKGKEHMVCKLDRSLYGLKQAPRCWNQKLDKNLINKGWMKSKADACIYTKGYNNDEILLAVYVDDLIMASASLQVIEKVKQELRETFKMKDMGKIGYYLGLEIQQNEDRSKVFVCQEHYVQKLIKKCGMNNCRPAKTPMEMNVKLRKRFSEELCPGVDCSAYQSIVGSLLFAALATRPDISGSGVSLLC